MLTDDLYSKHVVDVADMPEDRRIPYLTSIGDLSQEDIDEILEGIQELENFDQDQDLNIMNREPDDASERLLSDEEDALDVTKRKAQDMADEDDTSVTVTEEDTDKDGDVDKTTIKKETPEDDSELSDEDEAKIEAILNGSSTKESDSAEDRPHDEENSTNRIAKTLSEYRY